VLSPDRRYLLIACEFVPVGLRKRRSERQDLLIGQLEHRGLLAGHREDEYRNLVLLGGRKLFRGKNGFVEKSTHESHQTLI
jgi:hypothetical protein